ncbi:hypothetical protein F4553_003983 [Allocatelliglobosispora scoriae]|uniref:DUF4352 domain-containing protein n=1 Tax=Allocatelliglobosispora scoriae TaxID=643052 RepID=A0A841BQT1_9ACTN|nr:hypothetical protein [Allocatelliglobosispora scoriae]MBB5870604.1 hypothetical protein [Allocatelliglobosispora scoriae]
MGGWLRQGEDFLLQRLGVVIGVVALAISGLFGGLRAAEDPPVATAAVDQVVDGGPWRVTVTGARLLNDMPTLHLRDPGNYWVVVLVTVEITEKEGWGVLSKFFDMPPLADKPDQFPTIMLVRDGSQPNRLQPGMPEKLAFFWEQSAGTPPPTALTLSVPKSTYRESFITGYMEWLPDLDDDLKPVYAAKLTVPVVDKRIAPSPSAAPSSSPPVSPSVSPSASVKP